MADASHSQQATGQLLLDYGFSMFNISLAIFLLWLRRSDWTARLLAVGMIGTAAVFNLQAESVYESLSKTTFEVSAYWLHRVIAGGAYVYALLLFPDGRLIPRWPKWAKALLYVPATVAFALGSYRIQSTEESTATVPLILFFGLFTPVAAVISQGYRYRRSQTSEERHQSRLLFWALIPALLVGLLVGTQGVGSSLSPGLEGRGVQELPIFVFRIFQPVFALIPIALFAGLVRYRLWNIDRVITRTLVYGSLVTLIGMVYVGVVVGAGRIIGAQGSNLALSIAATAIIAFAFEPAKNALQKVANRLVYGMRATPYEVLSEFSERMGGSYAPEELAPRMARLLREGTSATRAEVWLRVGSEIRPEAAWPPWEDQPPQSIQVEGDRLPEFDEGTRAVAVRHQSELLAVLVVNKPPGETMVVAEERLLSDLASQAGLMLRNVRLTAELVARLEELRASRQRIVAAQDQERRRIERDIHDGAQQQLVALRVKLSIAERMAASLEDENAAGLKTMMEQMNQESAEALETLRDLARGIYPPLLAAEGLATALQSQSRKFHIPIEVVDEGVGRHPQEVEAAVYFCCLEALQNVAKYAEPAHVKVRLGYHNDFLEFCVADDGKGFDLARNQKGSGLQNIQDRVHALGGSVEITSAPGKGTELVGRVALQSSPPESS